MMGRDLVRPDAERHGALRMTEAARPILRGEAEITLREDTITAARDGPAVKALVSDEDAPLLSALKAKRRALAEAARVPAYVIFTDRTLVEMAENRPDSMDAMARISGVGGDEAGTLRGRVSGRHHRVPCPTRNTRSAANWPGERRARCSMTWPNLRAAWNAARAAPTSC